MTPDQFIKKWRGVELKERSASQSHFNDLCALLGEPDPISADKTGDSFTFEKGASKTSGGNGWADVWRKECFAWEYKGPKKDLDAAFRQLLNYSIALDNPPLLIVSDMDVIRIHTNWTNTVQHRYDITLDDLLDAGKRDLVKAAFTDPERLKPAKTRQMLTEQAAQGFAGLAQRLRERGNNPETVAHFVNRLVFCMFAEDVGLLPNKMFQRMLEHSAKSPQDFEAHARTLFAAMKAGGMVGFEKVEWFNGGLFDTDEALPLEEPDVKDVLEASKLDWSDIDPSIFGTLFERGLDPDKRSQLGAHYTDRDKIMLIVNPVIVEPLTAEWEETKAQIADALAKAEEAKSAAARTRQRQAAERLHIQYLEKLKNFRVLDPACGSGNFLYLSLLALKDLEHRANLEAEEMGLPRGFPAVGPECVKGIEINPYAAELARVSVWIGEIQWMRRNGFDAARNPILRPLDTIECRDAILNPDGTRAEWPDADVVVGNPPFVASRDMINDLGKHYTLAIRSIYSGNITGASDFVCYWYSQSMRHVKNNQSLVGLVATDSLPRGDSRFVIDHIVREFRIFNAIRSMIWYDRTESNGRKNSDVAQVRVCIICFGNTKTLASLDGNKLNKIESDLSVYNIGGFSRREIVRLPENFGIANQGIIPRANLKEKLRKELNLPKASFLLNEELAEKFVNAPLNPNGQSNVSVIKPYITGDDILNGRGHRYIVDFTGMSEHEASLYELPFAFLTAVRSHRANMNQPEALGRVDKLDSQIGFDLIQGSFCGGYCGAFADGRRRMGVL
jgi:hypothetical protein